MCRLIYRQWYESSYSKQSEDAHRIPNVCLYKRHVSNVFPAISFTSFIAKVIRKASTNSSTSSFTHVGVSTFDVRYMSGQIKNRTLNFN